MKYVVMGQDLLWDVMMGTISMVTDVVVYVGFNLDGFVQVGLQLQKIPALKLCLHQLRLHPLHLQTLSF